jgi:hypothetical protein
MKLVTLLIDGPRAGVDSLLQKLSLRARTNVMAITKFRVSVWSVKRFTATVRALREGGRERDGPALERREDNEDR